MFGFLECAVTAISIQFPFLKSLILQSDNAKTYQNHELIIGINFINMKLHENVFIKESVLTETQDGKTILDAHFAVATRKLLDFMKMWRKK